MSPDAADVEPIVVERRPPLLVIELNRPHRRNALDDPLRAALIEALRAAEDDEIRVVVLTGRGPDFCAGGDIDRLERLDPMTASWPSTRVDTALESCSRPIVAALHGNVLGGGFEIALACTLRIAAEGTRLALPEVRLGVMPGLGATQRLPRMVGEAVALDLVITGRAISAEDALRLGIVSRVVPLGAVRDEAIALAETVARRPPLSVRSAVDAVRRSFDLSRVDGIEYERRLFGLTCASEDRAEGIAAWRERRPPVFRGR